MLNNNIFEIKVSKTGKPIPVIDGIHLHSAYDPIKEASKFIDGHLKSLRENNNVLVFGLGLGYHLEAIEKSCREIWGNNFQVMVIEPNANTYREFNLIRPVELTNTTIRCHEDINF